MENRKSKKIYSENETLFKYSDFNPPKYDKKDYIEKYKI